MAKAISRNEPCPCGSGKKYKQCCIDKPAPAEKRSKLIPLIIALASIAGGVYAIFAINLEAGIAIAGGGLLVAGAWLAFRNPPPPSGGGNPAGLDFGR